MAELKEYRKLRFKFLKENPKCAVYPNLLACDVHHMRGRAGKLFLCTDFWLGVSREGHNKIGENPEWARKNGFLCPKGHWGRQPREG